jgi:hypothetical protein
MRRTLLASTRLSYSKTINSASPQFTVFSPSTKVVVFLPRRAAVCNEAWGLEPGSSYQNGTHAYCLTSAPYWTTSLALSVLVDIDLPLPWLVTLRFFFRSLFFGTSHRAGTFPEIQSLRYNWAWHAMTYARFPVTAYTSVDRPQSNASEGTPRAILAELHADTKSSKYSAILRNISMYYFPRP